MGVQGAKPPGSQAILRLCYPKIVRSTKDFIGCITKIFTRTLFFSNNTSEFAKGKSSHHENFILACMGQEKTRSPFSVSGPLSQMFTLGCMAQRLGGELEFDRENLRITNNKLANSLLKDEVRRGWEQYYKI